MTTSTIPTPHFNDALADLRVAVNALKPAVNKDIKAAVKDALNEAIIANGAVAASAQGTPPGSSKRQQLAANRQKLAAAAQTINDPDADDDDLNKVLAILQALTAATLASQPKPAEPVDPKAIATAVVDEIKPFLTSVKNDASPAPAPAPVPDPVDLKALVKDAADTAVAGVTERFTPLFATDPDGKPTKAASEASVTALAGRVDDLERTNVILGHVVDSQGNRIPSPGSHADNMLAALSAANRYVWLPAVIALAITFVIALLVGFISVQGPTYALWTFVLGFGVAAGIFLFNNRNRNRFSR